MFLYLDVFWLHREWPHAWCWYLDLSQWREVHWTVGIWQAPWPWLVHCFLRVALTVEFFQFLIFFICETIGTYYYAVCVFFFLLPSYSWLPFDFSQDGGRYEGEWVDDKVHGQGISVYANGNRYEGQWVDGKINGHGVLHYADGLFFFVFFLRLYIFCTLFRR